jgi:ABC-2 type transport system ATP-binding protein
MEPTSGQVTVRGRAAALMGLNSGFIDTMTGRENIFLNAAMHGVGLEAVREQLDAIIAFASIGDYINAPVKDYSSGMRARLGFSIAIHILPDIIFIDETLAVGDADFQEKCIQRIHQFQQEGRTLVFVSHSEQMVRRMCQRALLLHNGQLVLDGSMDAAYEAYHRL